MTSLPSPIDPDKFKSTPNLELARLALHTPLAADTTMSLSSSLSNVISGADEYVTMNLPDDGSADAILSHSVVPVQHLLRFLEKVEKCEIPDSDERAAFRNSPKIISLLARYYRESAEIEQGRIQGASDPNAEKASDINSLMNSAFFTHFKKSVGQDPEDPNVQDETKSHASAGYYQDMNCAKCLETVILPILRQLGVNMILPLNEPSRLKG